jgi:hypothetical protein
MFNFYGSVHLKYILIHIQQDATLHRLYIYIWKLLYMFWVVPLPIFRSAYNCIYSIWYLSHRYCYLPLSWKSWNRFECAVGATRHHQERIQLYLQHLVFVTPLLLSAAIVEELEPV